MKYIFTITQGRTGTLSLSRLFAENPRKSGKSEAILHEALHPAEVGHGFPGMLPPVHYNTQPGFTDELQEFWKRKWRSMERLIEQKESDDSREVDLYIESSHLLSKSGLVEVLVDSMKDYPSGLWPLNPQKDSVHIVLLHRPIFEIVCSMNARGDYQDLASVWTWHLDPGFNYNLLQAQNFDNPLWWYCWEMECRKKLNQLWVEGLEDQKLPIYFHDFHMEDFSQRDKCRELLERIRGEEINQYCAIPEKSNTSDGASEKLMEEFKARKDIIENPFTDEDGKRIDREDAIREVAQEHLQGQWPKHKGTTERTSVVELRLKTYHTEGHA